MFILMAIVTLFKTCIQENHIYKKTDTITIGTTATITTTITTMLIIAIDIHAQMMENSHSVKDTIIIIKILRQQQ